MCGQVREMILSPKELSLTSLNWTLSPDHGNVAGRGPYLLARLNEFLNCHHAILVPVHLLPKSSQVERTGGMTGERKAEFSQVPCQDLASFPSLQDPPAYPVPGTWKKLSTCSLGASSRSAG